MKAKGTHVGEREGMNRITYILCAIRSSMNDACFVIFICLIFIVVFVGSY